VKQALRGEASMPDEVGRALAEELLAAGADVILRDIDPRLLAKHG